MDHLRLQGSSLKTCWMNIIAGIREREREFDAKLPFPLEVCVGFDCWWRVYDLAWSSEVIVSVAPCCLHNAFQPPPTCINTD
jgi:hypothetical protein